MTTPTNAILNLTREWLEGPLPGEAESWRKRLRAEAVAAMCDAEGERAAALLDLIATSVEEP